MPTIDSQRPTINLVQAVNQAMHHAMVQDPSVLLMGQDIGKCGGVFRASEGLLEHFGKERVLDTPLAESAIIGCAVGMCIGGLRPIAEIQFSGFSYQAFHQIEQHVSRYCGRTQGQYPMSMVIRMPYGGNVRAFEHHSESREAYFIHTPGLKVVTPSNPQDAYGLLCSAIEDPDPVIFLEPKKLYRSVKQRAPDSNHRVKIGEAAILQEGQDLTLICYGAMVPLCQEVTQALQSRASIELIDLRSLSPWDQTTVVTSVQKTGRAVIVHEAAKTLGMAAEVSATLNERAFLYLKSPILRVTGYDIHPPYFLRETSYPPNVERVSQAVLSSLRY